MSSRGKPARQKIDPIQLIFRFLESKVRVQIILFENPKLRIEGEIIGFDEYMNLVLDHADEIVVKDKTKKRLGRILLKGDNISIVMTAEE